MSTDGCLEYMIEALKKYDIFYVDNNPTKETLLPIIKNIYTYYNSVVNKSDHIDEFYSSRIYS